MQRNYIAQNTYDDDDDDENTKENSISISISVIFCAFPEKKTTKKLKKIKLTSFQFFIVTKIIEFDEVVFFIVVWEPN